MSAEKELKALIDACLYMQECSSYVKDKRRQEIPNSVWSAWSKQLKQAKKKLVDEVSE